MKSSLPIDAYLDAILKAKNRNCIVSATPGSGKTTRIPAAYLPTTQGIILCIQPKRIACLAAAKRVADENGWQVGREVGYHVRLDKKLSPQTRLIFVTTGILLRYLCADPFLESVNRVIFDEFHERALENDLSFAMIRTIQRECRSDLAITVMSATLDTAPIAQFLSPCSLFDIDAPIYPLTLRYSNKPLEKHFPSYVESLMNAVETATLQTDGDCLVFLPGIAEIQSAIEIARSRFPNFDAYPCHASLPLETQTALLTLPTSSRRRIIFSTNVAESSLTIPGVKAVVDTGLVKQKFFETYSGLSRLEVQTISQASADQRAGRAARIAPGLCLRLWTKAEENAFNAQSTPEIERLDLSQAVLQIMAWGLEAPKKLLFLSQPAPTRIDDACLLLEKLGAIDTHGLTPIGQQMATIPLEPRLARWMLDAAKLGIERDAALLAAFLAETPYRRNQRAIWSKTDLFEDFLQLKRDIQKNECEYLRRIARDITSSIKEFLPSDCHPSSNEKNKTSTSHAISQAHSPTSNSETQNAKMRELLCRSMLVAYSDRLAQQRPQKNDAKLPKDDPRRETLPITACMSGNHGVTVKEPYTLKDAVFFICADLDLVRGVERASSRVVKAIQVDAKWIPWHETRVARYEPDKDRVVVADALVYDIFTLRETFLHGEEIAKLERKTLLDAARKSPEKALNFTSEGWLKFNARIKFAKNILHNDILPDFDLNWGISLLPAIADQAQAHSFADLFAIDLAPIAQKMLSHEARTMLQKVAPETVKLQNGTEVPVDYTCSPPVVRIKIQKAFGTYTLPKVGNGTIPVSMHFCAPNGRTVQMTQDLDNFWKTTYADLRKLLRGRYPKHDWPETPP